MSGAKEVRTQIGSIKNTQKITRAMEMVAASKMRKAQDRMAAGRPYASRIADVVSHLASANPEYKHLYLAEREPKRVAYIIVSTDRGLCGGLNINLFKSVIREMRDWKEKNVGVDLCLVGNKSVNFFRELGGNVVAALTHIGDKPALASLIGGIKVVLDAYNNGAIDRLYLVYNSFVNTMTQKPTLIQLMPLKPSEEQTRKYQWDYIYEPDAKRLIDGLLTRYIESLVYQATIENNACEQAARMIAMKSATDNAGDLIKELQLLYNKARQAAITQEISEIVGGAAAV